LAGSFSDAPVPGAGVRASRAGEVTGGQRDRSKYG